MIQSNVYSTCNWVFVWMLCRWPHSYSTCTSGNNTCRVVLSCLLRCMSAGPTYELFHFVTWNYTYKYRWYIQYCIHNHYAKTAQKIQHLYIATIFMSHFTYVYHMRGNFRQFCHMFSLAKILWTINRIQQQYMLLFWLYRFPRVRFPILIIIITRISVSQTELINIHCFHYYA